MFRSCDQNSDLFRDLNLMKVSELNGIVRYIVRSVCRKFACANVLSIFEFDAKDFDHRIQWFTNILLSLIYKNPRSRFMLELMVIFVSI